MSLAPIVCGTCGGPMTIESVTDGDTRLTLITCVDQGCDDPGLREMSERKPVTAFLSGEGSALRGCDDVIVGHIWVPVS